MISPSIDQCLRRMGLLPLSAAKLLLSPSVGRRAAGESVFSLPPPHVVSLQRALVRLQPPLPPLPTSGQFKRMADVFAAVARELLGASPSARGLLLESDLVGLASGGALSAFPLRDAILASYASRAPQPTGMLGARFPLQSLSPLVLQVNDVSDVSMSLTARVGAVRGGARGDAASGCQGGTRLLKLLLTDGRDAITAVEVRPSPALTRLRIGSKLAFAQQGCVVRWLGTGLTPTPSECTLLLTPEAIVGCDGGVRALALQYDRLTAQVASSLEGRAPRLDTQDTHDGFGATRDDNSNHRAESELDPTLAAVPSTVRYAPTKTTLLSAARKPAAAPATTTPTPTVVNSVGDFGVPDPIPTRMQHAPSQPMAEEEEDARDPFTSAIKRVAGAEGMGAALERPVAEAVLGLVQYCRILEVVSNIAIRSEDGSPYERLFPSYEASSRFSLLVVVDAGNGGGGQVVDIGHDLIVSELLHGSITPREFDELARDLGRQAAYQELCQGALSALAALPPLYMTIVPLLPQTETYRSMPTRPVAIVAQSSSLPPAVWEDAADAVLMVDE